MYVMLTARAGLSMGATVRHGAGIEGTHSESRHDSGI